MSIVIGVFCFCIAILGLSGALMGSGYIVNERKKLTNESEEVHQNLLRRERKTGWASVIAGFAVMIGSVPLGLIINVIVSKLDTIYNAVVH